MLSLALIKMVLILDVSNTKTSCRPAAYRQNLRSIVKLVKPFS